MTLSPYNHDYRISQSEPTTWEQGPMIPLISRVVPLGSGPHISIPLGLHVFPVKLLQKRNPFVNNSFPLLFVWSGTLFQYLRAKTSATIFTFTNTVFAKLTKTKLCITCNLLLGHKNTFVIARVYLWPNYLRVFVFVFAQHCKRSLSVWHDPARP